MTESIQQSLTNQLKSAIDHYDQKTKESGFWGGLLETLSQNRDNLQAILNNILAKNGIITIAEAQQAGDALQQAKQKELEASKKQYQKKMLTYALGGMLIIGAIILIIKRNK